MRRESVATKHCLDRGRQPFLKRPTVLCTSAIRLVNCVTSFGVTGRRYALRQVFYYQPRAALRVMTIQMSTNVDLLQTFAWRSHGYGVGPPTPAI
jgi:hypothetical protein